MSATAAGHAERQTLARISAPINGRTVFIRLNVPLSFAQFDPDVTGELIARRSARVQGQRQNLESRAKNHPHPRLRRGLSRDDAGEAHNRWLGTRHPNPTLSFIL